MDVLSLLFKKKKRLSNLQQPLSFFKLAQHFDIFYVCFDEPNRDQNWLQISTLLPKVQKVEGVVGFDLALKTCAKKAKTHHFFVIDGDNQLLISRFHNPIVIPEIQNDWVLSWSSYNPLNGLSYGNGGLKLWPRRVASQMKSHEVAGKSEDPTDYCFIVDYYLVDDHVTQTIINCTSEQAFRAGLREGVKMSLNLGKQTTLNSQNFHQVLSHQNRFRLKTWCEVGADVANGYWAILGARLGLKLNAIDKFSYKNINSFDWIDEYFKSEILDKYKVAGPGPNGDQPINSEILEVIGSLGLEIEAALGLKLHLLSPAQSAHFKESLQNPSRSGLLLEKSIQKTKGDSPHGPRSRF